MEALPALEVTERVALRFPATFGLKLALKVVLIPGSNEEAGAVTRNCFPSLPVTLTRMLEIVTDPVLVITKVFGLLVFRTAVVENLGEPDNRI